jgi:trehalose 6-phosphate synthase/phosphatase
MASDKKNTIVLISGRTTDVLDNWFGSVPVNLVAEHGAFIKIKESSWEQTITGNPYWKASVMQVLDRFTERCAGTFIEEKTLSLAWHYRNAEKELGFLRSRELVNSLMELSSHLDFQVIEGNKVIEARTRGIDKGTAAAIWLNEPHYGFHLAIGDDRTDEDMFRVIPREGYSIRVGLVPSSARFNLKSQKDVISFLKKLQLQDEISVIMQKER